MVGHVLREVVALLGAAPRLHRRRALVDRRIPLVGLAADEAVEVLEATAARRPRVERSHRARLVHRHLMALAELRRRVAVQLERLGQRRRRVGPHAGVARSRRGDLGDATHAHRVVVAARQQRLTRRRTQRRGVEPVVAQPARRQTFRRRCLDHAAERARRRETGVVDQHDQHIRSSRRRPRLPDRWKRRRRILRVVGDQARIRLMSIGDRKNRPARILLLLTVDCLHIPRSVGAYAHRIAVPASRTAGSTAMGRTRSRSRERPIA